MAFSVPELLMTLLAASLDKFKKAMEHCAFTKRSPVRDKAIKDLRIPSTIMVLLESLSDVSRVLIIAHSRLKDNDELGRLVASATAFVTLSSTRCLLDCWDSVRFQKIYWMAFTNGSVALLVSGINAISNVGSFDSAKYCCF